VNRRDFLKTSLRTAGSIFISSSVFSGRVFSAEESNAGHFDLAAVRNAEPERLFDEAIKALGGMSRFVKKGKTVLIKPNIGWNIEPQYAATTNPNLLKRIILHCKEAGASKIYVNDHPIFDWKTCYKISGIEKAAKDAGAIIVPSGSESYYHSTTIRRAKALKQAKLHEIFMSADTIINVPVLKHHFGSKMTCGLKNLIGTTWDMNAFHSAGLHESIADIATVRRIDLTVVDAFCIVKRNGPRGGDFSDLLKMKSLIASPDIVAADTAAAKLFGINPEAVDHIRYAADFKLGQMDLSKLRIKRIVL